MSIIFIVYDHLKASYFLYRAITMCGIFSSFPNLKTKAKKKNPHPYESWHGFFSTGHHHVHKTNKKILYSSVLDLISFFFDSIHNGDENLFKKMVHRKKQHHQQRNLYIKKILISVLFQKLSSSSSSSRTASMVIFIYFIFIFPSYSLIMAIYVPFVRTHCVTKFCFCISMHSTHSLYPWMFVSWCFVGQNLKWITQPFMANVKKSQ